VLFPLVSAYIYEQNGESYIPGVELFYMNLSIFGMMAGLALNAMDYFSGGKLNRSKLKTGH
jgi:hypothetical protein